MTEQPFTGTYTGKKFHFLDPQPEDICIEDIAQGLSMACRFSGQVKWFYSVAEHSVHVAAMVFKATGDLQLTFDALLHDASEAYIADIARPVKVYLADYSRIEAMAQAAIQVRFGLRPMDPLIKAIDNDIVRDEAEQLFKVIPDWVEQYERVGVTVKCWGPQKARIKFMELFTLLQEGL